MKAYYFISAFVLATVFSLSVFYSVSAEDLDELRSKINSHQSQISQLDKEISKYEKELYKVSRQKKTLQSAVRQIELSERKVQTNVKKTKLKIKNTETELERLNRIIKEKKEGINTNTNALAAAIRSINNQDTKTFVEVLLGSNKITDIFDDFEILQKFHSFIYGKVTNLILDKEKLEKNKLETIAKKGELSEYQKELESQKRSLTISKSYKDNLLKRTKNEEANYQAILAKKRAARKEFEAKLAQYESKLSYILDPKSIPDVGKHVLKWPLKHIHITQYFGNTAFAKSGAYNGQGHNGVDFGTPLGTPVMAAADGVVAAIGNTDAFPGCLSYGKWVLIKHYNGLTTMHGHLSKILVHPGQKVKVGEVFAHSGSTGYSTGPHLHFGLYVSDAVRVVKIGEIRKTRNCKQARIPIAPWSGYLNPLDYL